MVPSSANYLEIKKAHNAKINAAFNSWEPIDDITPPKLFTPELFEEAHEVFEFIMSKKCNKGKLFLLSHSSFLSYYTMTSAF